MANYNLTTVPTSVVAGAVDWKEKSGANEIRTRDLLTASQAL